MTHVRRSRRMPSPPSPPSARQVFQTKCIMEDVNEHEEVVGHYAAFERDHPDHPVVLDVRVRAPPGRREPLCCKSHPRLCRTHPRPALPGSDNAHITHAIPSSPSSPACPPIRAAHRQPALLPHALLPTLMLVPACIAAGQGILHSAGPQSCTSSPPHLPLPTRTHPGVHTHTSPPALPCIACSHGHLCLPPTHPPSPTPTRVQFEDPNGALVFERHGASEADFHFTTAVEGEYKLCFTAKGEGGAGVLQRHG